MTTPLECKHAAIMVMPHVKIQHANAMSSFLTWGFPSITSFLGLSLALERRLGPQAGLVIDGIGVVCHDHEAQVQKIGFKNRPALTRTPLKANGESASVIEEARINLEVSLVLSVRLADAHISAPQRFALAAHVMATLQTMRAAGGDVIVSPLIADNQIWTPTIDLVPEGEEGRRRHFKQLARSWLPGFILVSRADLLQARLAELQAADPQASLIDAWVDLSSVVSYATPLKDPTKATWQLRKRKGWIVPIPVGYTAVSKLYKPGEVANTRDPNVHHQFVEPIFSTGEWISPLRLHSIEDVVWFTNYKSDTSVTLGQTYLCENKYQPPVETSQPTVV